MDFPFDGVVTNLTQSFVLFRAGGQPVRANLTVMFAEYIKPVQNQQETDPDFTTYLVKRGDSLSAIAAKLYGDPALWRVIAAGQRIDDPRRLPIGSRLAIPKVDLRVPWPARPMTSPAWLSLSVNGTALPLAVEWAGARRQRRRGGRAAQHVRGGARRRRRSNDTAPRSTAICSPSAGRSRSSWASPTRWTTLISGEITGLEPSFLRGSGRSSSCAATIGATGCTARPRDAHFVQQKDSDIAATIVQEVGLTPQVTDSQVVHDYVLQANQTDMEFLQERARRIEYEMVVDGQDAVLPPGAERAERGPDADAGGRSAGVLPAPVDHGSARPRSRCAAGA